MVGMFTGNLWSQAGARTNQLKGELAQFKEAFKNNNFDSLRSRLVFPYLWESGCSETKISNLEDFKQIEKDVFDEKIRKAVEDQSADDVHLNEDGASFGQHGELWISAFDDAMPISSVHPEKGYLSRFSPSKREPLKPSIAGLWFYDHAKSVGGSIEDWAKEIKDPHSISISLQANKLESTGIVTTHGDTILDACIKCSGPVWVESTINDPDGNADKGSLTYSGIDNIPGRTINIRACTNPNEQWYFELSSKNQLVYYYSGYLFFFSRHKQ